jgi:hypothetical protein
MAGPKEGEDRRKKSSLLPQLVGGRESHPVGIASTQEPDEPLFLKTDGQVMDKLECPCRRLKRNFRNPLKI